jgi:ParB-like nuclease domain.
MDNLKFTISEAIEFSRGGKIEEWVHLFLNSVGNNSAFSDGLKLQKRYWTGPVHMKIHRLKRCCGPEPDMKFFNPPDEWENHINRFRELIQSGWDMPPLIAQHEGDELIVNDGNHRLEAMSREGFERCWVIIWNTHYQDDVNDFCY